MAFPQHNPLKKKKKKKKNIYIYVYIYIYHIEGAVFATIWCSMYKVQSVDSRNAEKEKNDSLLL